MFAEKKIAPKSQLGVVSVVLVFYSIVGKTNQENSKNPEQIQKWACAARFARGARSFFGIFGIFWNFPAGFFSVQYCNCFCLFVETMPPRIAFAYCVWVFKLPVADVVEIFFKEKLSKRPSRRTGGPPEH